MSDSDNMSILSKVVCTRNFILRAFCGIYLSAFLSFYIQAEGEINFMLPLVTFLSIYLREFQLPGKVDSTLLRLIIKLKLFHYYRFV